MTKELVSVIIPVYNAEKYLAKCLDSVLQQTYQKLEIIAVNDGSSDGSYEILKAYSNKYPNIFKIFTQENQGQSAARNFALNYVGGEYTTFLDSDDYLEKDYIETLATAARENQSDMVSSGEIRQDESGNIVSVIRYKTDKNGNCVLRRLNFSGKLYRTDFLKKHNMQFAVGKVYEDNPFNIEAYALAQNLKIVDYIGYYQTVHIGSTTTKKISTDRLPFTEIESMIQYVEHNKSDVADYALFEYTTLSFFTYFLFKANKQHYYFDINGRKSSNEVVYEICDYVERIIKQYFTDAYKNPYVKIFGNYGVSVTQSIGVFFFLKLVRWNKLKKFIKIYYGY